MVGGHRYPANKSPICPQMVDPLSPCSTGSESPWLPTGFSKALSLVSLDGSIFASDILGGRMWKDLKRHLPSKDFESNFPT